MIIGSIKDGIVIDHIPNGRGLELYQYLGLDKLNCEVALIKNATSEKRERKDILKIGQIIDLNYDLLGYIDPHITVNFIENGVRVRKVHPQLPERITDIIRCKNPRCITSVEHVPHVFRLADRENAVYRCIYCDVKADEQGR